MAELSNGCAYLASDRLNDEPDLAFSICGQTPPEVAFSFVSKFGELCCQAFDGINRILVGRIGIRNRLPVDHLVVGKNRVQAVVLAIRDGLISV